MKTFSILLIAVVVFSQSLFAGGLEFRNIRWEEARAAATQEHKLIFVDAYTDWCGWCKVLERKTFTDDSVIAFMNTHFVCLKLDMERDFGRTLSMKYRVNVYPSQLIFSGEGKLLYTSTGYLKPPQFLEAMNESMNPAKQRTYPGIGEAMDPGFPDFYKSSFVVSGSKAEMPGAETVNTFLDGQKDLFSEVSWSVMQHLQSRLNPKYVDQILRNGPKYAELFGTPEVNTEIERILSNRLNAAAKEKSAGQFNQAVEDAEKYLLAGKENTITQMRITYYEQTGDWSHYADQYDRKFADANFSNPTAVTRVSARLYEHCSDPEVLKRATAWMKKAVDQDPSYETVDTYAGLLFKTGMTREAEQYAREAIDMGKKSMTDVSSTEKLLARIMNHKEATSR